MEAVENWTAPPPHMVGSGERQYTMPTGEQVWADYIGFYTSERPDHSHVLKVPQDGKMCGACRWFEMSLFRVDDGYVLVRHNITEVRGESDRVVTHRVDDPADLVDLGGLSQRSRPLREVLLEAADHDERAQMAFVDLYGGKNGQ